MKPLIGLQLATYVDQGWIDLDEPIGSYGLSLARGYVGRDAHLFEVMARMADSTEIRSFGART